MAGSSVLLMSLVSLMKVGLLSNVWEKTQTTQDAAAVHVWLRLLCL